MILNSTEGCPESDIRSFIYSLLEGSCEKLELLSVNSINEKFPDVLLNNIPIYSIVDDKLRIMAQPVVDTSVKEAILQAIKDAENSNASLTIKMSKASRTSSNIKLSEDKSKVNQTFKQNPSNAKVIHQPINRKSKVKLTSSFVTETEKQYKPSQELITFANGNAGLSDHEYAMEIIKYCEEQNLSKPNSKKFYRTDDTLKKIFGNRMTLSVKCNIISNQQLCRKILIS